MAKIIAVANQKGGVGKTTTCVNLGASLAAAKRRVLLVDLDPQGNATMGSGVEKNSLSHTTNDVLLNQVSITQAIVKTDTAGYDLLPANGELTAAEVGLLNEDEREFRLSKAIHIVQQNYDFIIIDCPPSLNMLTINGLVAAESVLIPMQCEYYALEGLSGLMETIEMLIQTVKPRLCIEGLLRTMYDSRNKLTVDVSEQLMAHFKEKVFRTTIPRNVRLAEAPSYGLPILYYDKKSAGSEAYLALAGEMLRKMETVVEPIRAEILEEELA